MTTGIVKWFNHLRGFGFIEPDDGGPDVFVTIRAVERSGLGHVDEGRRVRYELMPSATSGRAVFNLQDALELPLQNKPQALTKPDMRAVLFVAQAHLQRSLGRDLEGLGFDVILPVTLGEARRSLQPSLCAPDLLVMNFRDTDGESLELLDVIWEHELKISVVLIAEATDVATIRHSISLAGVVVLPTERDSFRDSVRRLYGLETHG
jgi:CspA family cold shock protein